MGVYKYMRIAYTIGVEISCVEYEEVIQMDKNLSYFIESFKDLLEKYRDKFIVIKDQTVIAACDSFDDACTEAAKEEPGTYIIQYCVPEAMVPDAKLDWNTITFTQVPV